jgi:hypothetical protein
MTQTDAEPPSPTGTRSGPVGPRRQADGDADRPMLSWPIASVVILAAVLVMLVAGGVFLRQLTAPPAPVAVAPTTVLTLSVPTVSAAPTTLPQTVVQATLPAASTAETTRIPTSGPTPAPASVAMTATPPDAASDAQPSEPTPLPTVPPELRREVEAAYTQYWDARAQAVWTLDPAPLDDVATGDELEALRSDVEQLRADGRAIKAEVEHQYTVISVDGDEAQVGDRLRDFSIYVDAATKEPLPGQVRPDEASAPLSTILYFLRNEGGTWKVERGERHVNN